MEKYSKNQLEVIYKGSISSWVNNGCGDVAIMKDGSEVFLDKQEIFTWKGWSPLNKINIKKHKALITENLAGKYDNADPFTLLKEAGYKVIKKN
jgi:hypothetical protein